LEDSQLLVPFRQLTFKAGNFCSLFVLALRGCGLILLFAAPVVELGFIQAEFAGCGGHTDALHKLQGFTAKFRRVLFTGHFLN